MVTTAERPLGHPEYLRRLLLGQPVPVGEADDLLVGMAESAKQLMPMSGLAVIAGQTRSRLHLAAPWAHSESMAMEPLRCRLGWHKWVPKSNEDGSRYRGCAHCPKVDQDAEPIGPIPG